jgi:hypothetical protein
MSGSLGAGLLRRCVLADSQTSNHSIGVCQHCRTVFRESLFHLPHISATIIIAFGEPFIA